MDIKLYDAEVNTARWFSMKIPLIIVCKYVPCKILIQINIQIICSKMSQLNKEAKKKEAKSEWKGRRGLLSLEYKINILFSLLSYKALNLKTYFTDKLLCSIQLKSIYPNSMSLIRFNQETLRLEL